MKLLKTSVAVASLLMASVSSFAQTAEEIVSKHLKAIGGADGWKKVETIKMNGAMTAQGMEIPLNITIQNNKAWRLDLEIMGTSNYQILTNSEGWAYFPIQQMQKPEPMTPDMVKAMKNELDIAGDFVDYKAKGNKFEFLGKDEVEGTEALKLKLTSKDGKEKTYFLDATNYYIIREVEKIVADGQEVEMATNYSNYQKLEGGLIFPMTIESPQGPITFKSVELNPKVDESIFKPAN